MKSPVCVLLQVSLVGSWFKVNGSGEVSTYFGLLSARISHAEMAPARFGNLVLFMYFLSSYLHALTDPG